MIEFSQLIRKENIGISKKGVMVMLFLICIGLSGSAQQREIARSTNGWLMLNSKLQVHQKWSISGEIHLRRADVYKEWQQFIARPAINYAFNPHLQASLGYSYVKNFPYGEQPIRIPLTENNIWQQILLKHNLGKVAISHRYRLEERFIGTIQQTGAEVYEQVGTEYAQRFRYRLTTSFPLLSLGDQKRLSALIFDELWINMEDQLIVSSFNQNWFYVGLEYQFNKWRKVQLGFLDQLIRKADGVHYERNPCISLGLFFNFNLEK